MGGCLTLLLLSKFLFPKIHLANSNLYHPLFLYFLKYCGHFIGVMLFTAGWVSLHGLLSYLVVSPSNNLVSLFITDPLSQKQKFLQSFIPYN